MNQGGLEKAKRRREAKKGGAKSIEGAGKKEEGCRKKELKKKKKEARAQQIATQTKKRGRNGCGIYDHETITRRRSTLPSCQDGTGPSRSKPESQHFRSLAWYL